MHILLFRDDLLCVFSSFYFTALVDTSFQTFARSCCLHNMTASQSSEPSTSAIKGSFSTRLGLSPTSGTTCSLEKAGMRRKLRTRRFLRSGSDLEHPTSLMSSKILPF